jgi:hypothetical protein
LLDPQDLDKICDVEAESAESVREQFVTDPPRYKQDAIGTQQTPSHANEGLGGNYVVRASCVRMYLDLGQKIQTGQVPRGAPPLLICDFV